MAGSPGISIALLGDVMLGRKVAEEIAAAPERGWSDEVIAITRSCDLVIANLECCLSERGSPTELLPGKPFFFRGPPRMIRALTTLGDDVAAGLANNHALDFGPDALLDTLATAADAGIAVAGSGHDAATARRGAGIEVAGTRVGLLALSDHPAQYAAGDDAPGIAYADLRRGVPEWVQDELARLRRDADLVVAFPHWGPNMTTRTAAWQRDAAVALAEAGADLVAGHSAHCFHGAGWADGAPLLFDLGDALDDYAVDAKLRNDLGLLAIWRPGGEPEVALVGLALDYCHTRLATGDDADWIAARLEIACAQLGTGAARVGEQRFALSRAAG